VICGSRKAFAATICIPSAAPCPACRVVVVRSRTVRPPRCPTTCRLTAYAIVTPHSVNGFPAPSGHAMPRYNMEERATALATLIVTITDSLWIWRDILIPRPSSRWHVRWRGSADIRRLRAFGVAKIEAAHKQEIAQQKGDKRRWCPASERRVRGGSGEPR